MTIQELVNYIEFKKQLKTGAGNLLYDDDNIIGRVFKRTWNPGFFVPIEIKDEKIWGVSIDIKNGQVVVVFNGGATYTGSVLSSSSYKDCGPLKDFVKNAINYHKIEEKKKEIEKLKEQLKQAENELRELMN